MDVRERIIEDAGKLFFRKGIKRVTMDDVAYELGISKRTIYENFKDKNHLLEAILQANLDLQKNKVAQLENQSENALEVMVGILKCGHESISQISPAYFSDLQRFYPKIYRSVINKGREGRTKNLEYLLERGKSEALFRSDINSFLVAKVFSEQLAMLSNSDLFPSDLYPRNELFETIFLYFLRGISTRKGIVFLESILENGV